MHDSFAVGHRLIDDSLNLVGWLISRIQSRIQTAGMTVWSPVVIHLAGAQEITKPVACTTGVLLPTVKSIAFAETSAVRSALDCTRILQN